MNTQKNREYKHRNDHLKTAIKNDDALRNKHYGSATTHGRALLTATVNDAEGKTKGDTISFLATKIEETFRSSLVGTNAGKKLTTAPIHMLLYAAEDCFVENGVYSPGIEKTKENYAIAGVTPWHCISMITLKTLLDAGMVSGQGHINVGSTLTQLGEFIWAQAADWHHFKSAPQLRRLTHERYGGSEATEVQGVAARRHASMKALDYINKRLDNSETPGQRSFPRWSDKETSKVGALLWQIVQAHFPTWFNVRELPKQGNKKARKVFILSPELQEQHIERLQAVNRFMLDAWPMSQPPLPWILEGDQVGAENTSGGFHAPVFRSRNPLIRSSKQSHTQPSALLVNYLNQLGEVPYTVSQKIYDAIEWAVLNRKPIDKLRSMPTPTVAQMQKGQEFFQWPIKPPTWDNDHPDEEWFGSKEQKWEKTAICNKAALQEKKAIKTIGLLHNAKTVMQEFGTDKPLWFSWSADTRGRSYPQQPLCQPQSLPAERALFRFQEGCMLNPDSLNQVLIGIGGAAIGTKGTHEDRLLYAKQNVERLCDLATDYGHSAIERLAVNEDADETWKLYSLLLEYQDVVIDKSRSTWHVPLEIDMTCSGLSLFSGILRDPVGMLATNALMSPDGLVQDAYRNVVETAMKLLEHSITLNITSNELPFKSPEFRAWRKVVSGHWARKHTHTPEIALRLLDVFKQGGRSLGKPTILQAIYGGSHSSARKKVQAILDEQKIILASDSETHKMLLSELVSYTIKAAEMCFPKAFNALSWIRKMASISMEDGEFSEGVFDRGLFWRMPDGMVVNHRPTYPNLFTIEGFMFGTVLCPSGYTEEIQPSKVMSGAAPNFIHSIDSYLLRTSFDGWKKPLFSIHDAVCVLPSDLSEARKRLSEGYIRTCRDNTLHALGEANGVGADLLPRPVMGTADLSKVIDSKFLFN